LRLPRRALMHPGASVRVHECAGPAVIAVRRTSGPVFPGSTLAFFSQRPSGGLIGRGEGYGAVALSGRVGSVPHAPGSERACVLPRRSLSTRSTVRRPPPPPSGKPPSPSRPQGEDLCPSPGGASTSQGPLADAQVLFRGAGDQVRREPVGRCPGRFFRSGARAEQGSQG